MQPWAKGVSRGAGMMLPRNLRIRDVAWIGKHFHSPKPLQKFPLRDTSENAATFAIRAPFWG